MPAELDDMNHRHRPSCQIEEASLKKETDELSKATSGCAWKRRWPNFRDKLQQQEEPSGRTRRTPSAKCNSLREEIDSCKD